MAHVNVERSTQQYSVVQLEDSQGSSGNLARFFPFYWIQVKWRGNGTQSIEAAFEETLKLRSFSVLNCNSSFDESYTKAASS